MVANPAEADVLYNSVKWGNPMDECGVFKVTQPITVYFGKVVGGTGWQFYIPNPGTAIVKIGAIAL